MKLIARLTLRALKENRRRTMATMLAIIIAIFSALQFKFAKTDNE